MNQRHGREQALTNTRRSYVIPYGYKTCSEVRNNLTQWEPRNARALRINVYIIHAIAGALLSSLSLRLSVVGFRCRRLVSNAAAVVVVDVVVFVRRFPQPRVIFE